MEKRKKINILARGALFAAALIWGSSFVVVKSNVDVFSPFALLGFRFSIAGILLSIIFWKQIVTEINIDYIWKGGIIGLFLFLAYGTQTIGITETTPGKNAFLTAIYCVFVPFMFWIVNKKKPDMYNFLAAIVCITGIGLVSLTGDFSIGFGDGLTLIGGVLFAAHLVSIAVFAKDKSPVLLTILQFGVCAVLSWIMVLITDSFPTELTSVAVWEILYLAVFPTAIALLLQNIGQKYTHPAVASIILSLESVFGVVFSILFYGEKVTIRLASGFILIFLAIIISETKLSFLKRSHK